MYVCTCVCFLVFFLPLLLSSALLLQHTPISIARSLQHGAMLLAKATSIQLLPVGAPLGNCHSAKVTDIAAFTANICYSQSPLIMVPVSLPFMANTEEPFSATSYSAAMVYLLSHTVLLFITAPPLPPSGKCDSTGPLLG